mgnify:CR=1 FL=1|jgi:hypothetical protein|tara:strand:- start:419 stop:673 length:255 start_codon:yes stop_codon:yes gene_type:complete
MSEINPFDDIDMICEYISCRISFDNNSQLEQFIKELNERIRDSFDPDYSSESSVSSEEIDEKEVVKEKFKVKKDEKDFYEIIVD